jgi:hypothetical protein
VSSSLIRSGAAALVATLAFAACAGGSSSIPSSGASSAGTSYRGVPVTDAAGANPCPINIGGWNFGGSCSPIVLKTSGGKGGLKAYEGYTISSELSSGTQKNGQVVVFADATGNGDITGKLKGKKFPLLKGAFLYLEGLNTGAAFVFNKSPGIAITAAKGFPGKTCVLSELAATGKWTSEPLPSGIKGKTLTFPSLTVPGGQDVPSGPFFIAFSCGK